MTTIAFDGKSMASDSQRAGNFIDNVSAEKIFRSNGRLVGFAGNAGMHTLFLSYLETGKLHPLLDMSGSEALVVGEDGVFWYGTNLQPVPTGTPAAIGSGGGYAMAAMYSGKTAAEAVRIACRLDEHSGGEVQELLLGASC